MTYLLHQDPNMIEVLEKDLISKLEDIAVNAAIEMGVHGVFSLDDLENLAEDDLCRHLATGVAYLGAEDVAPHAPTTNTNAARVSQYNFIIVLAVPVTKAGSENRYDGSKMLSAIRQNLQGKSVFLESPVAPRWYFVKELPQPSDSNNTMLYYSQVWRVSLPTATKP